MSNWKYIVIKKQRGSDGAWFAHKTAATFESLSEAKEYAETFAASQRGAGVSGTRVVVLSRRKFDGDYGPTNCVADIRV